MAPVFARMIGHYIDEHGHEKGQDGGAVAYLVQKYQSTNSCA